jgi:hypothetical protein
MKENKTVIKNGVKYTDGDFTPQNIADTTFDVNKRSSKNVSGIKKSVFKNNIKHSKTYKKQVLNDLYEELNIRRIDSDE